MPLARSCVEDWREQKVQKAGQRRNSLVVRLGIIAMHAHGAEMGDKADNPAQPWCDCTGIGHRWPLLDGVP